MDLAYAGIMLLLLHMVLLLLSIKFQNIKVQKYSTANLYKYTKMSQRQASDLETHVDI